MGEEEARESGTASMDEVVELEGLSVDLGNRRILQNLTASFSGRALGLLGPNGAGKTTLIRTLLGFYKPAAGEVRVLGHEAHREARTIRTLVGYMPEEEAFISGMSAVTLLRMMAELSGLPARQALERTHEALFFVGLGEARYRDLETYSLGMKQLAKLAQALVHGPRLIILDEPSNGLDPPARERMIRLIRRIGQIEGVHLILSSHLLGDVEACCQEVLILKEGRIAVHCNLEEERRTHRRFLEVETTGGSPDFLEAIRRLGCECAQVQEGRIKMVLPAGVGVRDLYRVAARRGTQIRRLSSRRDSLEDIFIRAMEGTPDGRLPA